MEIDPTLEGPGNWPINLYFITLEKPPDLPTGPLSLQEAIEAQDHLITGTREAQAT